ncbi:cytochrome c [Acidiphilium sp. AL]|nr:cytochrome c [Acidiphilium sp. AL]
MRRTNLTLAPAAGAVLLALAAPASAATISDHASSAAALRDIKAAIAVITGAEDAAASGPASYRLAAQSAINALVGEHSRQFVASVPNPGDAGGAIGQVNHLLDRRANPPFVPVLHGVLVNVLAAVGHLQDARKARGLTAFEVASSRALEDLDVAQGRASEYDVLGGMAGAIANTGLGVPAGAAILNGCAAPARTGYGMSHGWLAWRAVTLSDATIPDAGAAFIRKDGNMVVFYTAAAPMVRHLCDTHAAAIRPTVTRAKPKPARLIEVAAQAAATKALYTAAQAKQGKAVYSADCASCHGGNLQGVAAPAIAGKDFLATAKKDGWTVGVIRTIVTQNMPFNNPASLKPAQYAEVIAYLLASNCYPAGKTAFPEHAPTDFATMKIVTPAHPAGTPNMFGVCAVK